jgi:hypothetical protein
MAYPGDKSVSNQTQARCNYAFVKYDRMAYGASLFDYQYVIPDNTTWPSGDRFVVCVAYEPDAQGSGALPLNYSIKGIDE